MGGSVPMDVGSVLSRMRDLMSMLITPLDIFGQVQEILWTVIRLCLNVHRGNLNKSLHVYVLKFYLTSLWGVGVLRILGGS